MENPLKMDDLGVPLFLETPTSWKVEWMDQTRCTSTSPHEPRPWRRVRPSGGDFERISKDRHQSQTDKAKDQQSYALAETLFYSLISVKSPLLQRELYFTTLQDGTGQKASMTNTICEGVSTTWVDTSHQSDLLKMYDVGKLRISWDFLRKPPGLKQLDHICMTSQTFHDGHLLWCQKGENTPCGCKLFVSNCKCTENTEKIQKHSQNWIGFALASKCQLCLLQKTFLASSLPKSATIRNQKSHLTSQSF